MWCYISYVFINPVRAGLFGHASGPGGGLNVPTGERWPVMASEATAEAKKRKNIVPDIFLYL